MFKRIYILGVLLILLISMVFIMQYSYMNNIIIKSKETNIERSREVLGQKINGELKLYSQVIESTSNLIMTNNWSKDEIAYNLKHIFEQNSIFSLLYYGDTENNFINATNWEAPDEYKVKTRPWYIKALEERALVFSETYVDAVTGELSITISEPIYDSKQQIRGVIGGDILIKDIIELVNNASTGIDDMGYSFLIDSSGNILAHPDYIYDDLAHLKNIDEISRELSLEMKRDLYGKKQITIDGMNGYMSYQPIENTDWIIGSFSSMNEYNANSKYLLRILVAALLVALCIFWLFISLQNKYFIKPLKLLIGDIEDITIDDDVSYRISLNERDPFVQLRKSVNNILEKAELFFREQQEYSEELMATHEELEAQNVQLYHLSNYDQLTRLYNRRFFEKKLEELDIEENLPLGIIMADVNGLKLINDSFGHKVGDQLLKETGKALRKGCMDKDLVFRIGGDEFVIILPQTNQLEVQKVIKEIRSLTKQVSLKNIKLSVSFGIGIKHNESEDIASSLKKAEDDMYSNKLVEGPSMRSKTIDTIVKTLFEKNAREEAHSSRVSSICQQMGAKLEMSDDKIKQLETVGLLHDIGKIAISNRILEKPGSLTKEEWAEIAKHPEIGYRILGTTIEMGQIAEYALSHHERYDGKGYPQGLKGEEIPLVSRIITIADSYDAMISDRPYRKGMPEEIVVQEIIKNAGIQFDPVLARLFVVEVLKKEWIEIVKQ